MKQVMINLYDFDELSSIAQEKAIEEHQLFLADIMHELYPIEQVIESIRINEYLFYADGELAQITHYTGGHEKSGVTEFHLHGETYTI